MLKRNLGVLMVAGLVVGGGAVAWAEGAPARPTVTVDPATKAQLKTCLQQARANQDKAAAQKCFADAGVTPGHKGAGGAGRGGGGGGDTLGAGRMVHGDLIVQAKDGTFQHVTVDRGTLLSKDGGSITVKRADGPTVTIKVDANTKYLGGGSLNTLETGKPVGVLSKDGTATVVRQPKPKPAPAPGAGTGTAPGTA
jgi:hypothetical protein